MVVRTDGIGQHTVMGMTIDEPAAITIDKFARELFLTLIMTPRDEEVQKFLADYQKITGKKLAPSYLDSLAEVDKMPRDWRLLELLASVGNPMSFEMPSVLVNDPTADMSFTGVQTFGSNLVSSNLIDNIKFYEPNDPLDGISELRMRRPRRQLSLVQITNLAASLSFSLNSVLQRGYIRSMSNEKRQNDGSVKFVGVVGEHLQGDFGKHYIERKAFRQNYSTQAAMNAHMAWKLLEGNQANDLCHENWDLYESVFDFLPLGNYNLLSKMYKGPVTKSIKETLKNENASK